MLFRNGNFPDSDSAEPEPGKLRSKQMLPLPAKAW